MLNTNNPLLNQNLKIRTVGCCSPTSLLRKPIKLLHPWEKLAYFCYCSLLILQYWSTIAPMNRKRLDAVAFTSIEAELKQSWSSARTFLPGSADFHTLGVGHPKSRSCWSPWSKDPEKLRWTKWTEDCSTRSFPFTGQILQGSVNNQLLFDNQALGWNTRLTEFWGSQSGQSTLGVAPVSCSLPSVCVRKLVDTLVQDHAICNKEVM